MGTVIIALMPALVASVIIFGPRALLVTAVTVAAAVLFEFAWCHLRHQPDSIQDLSAVVTGLLLAFNVPSTIPLWMPVVGAFVSIVIVKELFGGIGRNFANPAIVGRMVLAVSFTSRCPIWICCWAPMGACWVRPAPWLSSSAGCSSSPWAPSRPPSR